MSAKIGSYTRKCPFCRNFGLVMRIGRDSLTCRCEDCRMSFKAPKEEPKRTKQKPVTQKPKPIEQKTKKTKRATPKRVNRTKRPTVRTYAGLRGQRERKNEWLFGFSTDQYGLLALETKKNTWGNWSVWWAAERVASGDTIKEALEKAIIRLGDRGYHLANAEQKSRK